MEREGGVRMRFRGVIGAVFAAGWLVVAGAPAPAGGVEPVVAGAAGPTSAGWAGRPASGSAGVWEWPLPEHTLAAPYAAPATRYAAGHRGVDFPAAAGAVVRAPDDATVRFSGVVVDRPLLTLDHGDGVLSSFEPLVSELPVGSIVAR